jgi:hypothetical protein
MARGPIIFDFRNGQVYRDNDDRSRPEHVVKDLMREMAGMKRVKKTVEGLPPHVTQPKT